MLCVSRTVALAEACVLFDLIWEEIGRHVVGHQQLVKRLALIGTRYLAWNLFLGSFLLRVLLTGPRYHPESAGRRLARRARRRSGASYTRLSSNVAKMRISVDLPAPLGQSRPYISTGIVRVTSFSACTLLK